jgi:hypothetical protein
MQWRVLIIIAIICNYNYIVPSVSVRYRDNIKKEMVSYARHVEQIMLIERRGVEISIWESSHTNVDILTEIVIVFLSPSREIM